VHNHIWPKKSVCGFKSKYNPKKLNTWLPNVWALGAVRHGQDYWEYYCYRINLFMWLNVQLNRTSSFSSSLCSIRTRINIHKTFCMRLNSGTLKTTHSQVKIQTHRQKTHKMQTHKQNIHKMQTHKHKIDKIQTRKHRKIKFEGWRGEKEEVMGTMTKSPAMLLVQVRTTQVDVNEDEEEKMLSSVPSKKSLHWESVCFVAH